MLQIIVLSDRRNHSINKNQPVFSNVDEWELDALHELVEGSATCRHVFSPFPEAVSVICENSSTGSRKIRIFFI